jgi:hypothetical protein
MFDQFREGYRDSDFLNFMLKIKRGGGLWDLFYFRKRSLDYWRGGLEFLTLVVVCHIFSGILHSGRLAQEHRASQLSSWTRGYIYFGCC